jgi:hypothetical protein
VKKRVLLFSSAVLGGFLLLLIRQRAAKLSRSDRNSFGESDDLLTERVLRVIDRAGLPRSTLDVSVQRGQVVVSGPLSLPGLNSLLHQVISLPGVKRLTRRHQIQR